MFRGLALLAGAGIVLTALMVLSACAYDYDDAARDERSCGEYIIPFAAFAPCMMQRIDRRGASGDIDAKALTGFKIRLEQIKQDRAKGLMTEEQAYADYNLAVNSLVK